MPTVLLVEDEALLGRTLQESLTDEGYRTYLASTGEDALQLLRTHKVDLALIDIRLPGIDGMEVLERVVDEHPDLVPVMMTAHGDVACAVRAMKIGAADFLTKPLDLDTVSLSIKKNLRHHRIARRLKHEQQQRAQSFGLHQIIGECPQVERAKALVRRMCRLGVAASERPPNVLITGETGTGKDLLARAFHYEGPRRAGPFVHINCAALPESLAESELFGHVKGAFTDARTSKTGLFEVAEQGTIFLDEVNSLAPAVQAKLLGAIETRRIRPVGCVDERPVDVHMISAMNADPRQLIQAGHFREDLYHRLRVIEVALPPLRERGADLMKLADFFLAAHSRRFSMSPKKLSPDARRALQRYAWPGNVRELAHAMESAVLLGGDVIEADLLPTPRTPRPRGNGSSVGEVVTTDFSDGPISLEDVERELIVRALDAADGNVTRAAELLSVSRDTIRYRVEKHRLAEGRNGVKQ